MDFGYRRQHLPLPLTTQPAEIAWLVNHVLGDNCIQPGLRDRIGHLSTYEGINLTGTQNFVLQNNQDVGMRQTPSLQNADQKS